MKLAELNTLSGPDRAAYYRQQARSALRVAEASSDPAISVAHLLMAESWEKLAKHCAGLDRHRFSERSPAAYPNEPADQNRDRP